MFANSSLEVIHSKDFAGEQIPSGYMIPLKSFMAIRGQVLRLNALGQPEVYIMKETLAALMLERLVISVDLQSYNSDFI